MDLFLSFRCKYGCCSSLDNIRHPVKFGGLTPEPELVQGGPFKFQFFGNYGVAAAGTGKAGCLGEGAEFDGAASCAFDLKMLRGSAGS